MKFVFIQPPSSLLLEDKVMPPLGILYLAAWLRKYQHQPEIIDLAGVSDWHQRLRDERYKLEESHLIGLTATTPQYPVSQAIVQDIRALGFQQPVVVGGIHVTSLVHANELDFLKDPFDSFVIGEGYNAVTKMCNDVAAGTLKKTYAEPILKDVNELPFAARDLIDIRGYKYKLGDTPATSQYTQYGCPYACQYCESPMAGSWTIRAMHPDRIAAEVKQVRDEFGIYGNTFFDDEMNLDMKRMLRICEKLKQLEDIRWRGFVVTAKWNSDLAMACKESGCYEIASGIESGSPTILKNIKKPATVDINRRFVLTSKKAGLRVKAFLIVGLPGETWETVQETNRFLESLQKEGFPPDDIDVSILQIYPGAPLYQKPQDVEFQSFKDYEKMYYKSSPTNHTEMVQVKTHGMSKYDLISARNWLESKYKKKNWIADYTGRKDLDRVYETPEIAESIQYAEKMIASLK